MSVYVDGANIRAEVPNGSRTVRGVWCQRYIRLLLDAVTRLQGGHEAQPLDEETMSVIYERADPRAVGVPDHAKAVILDLLAETKRLRAEVR